MSKSVLEQSPKKETVYSGPAPQQGAMYASSSLGRPGGALYAITPEEIAARNARLQPTNSAGDVTRGGRILYLIAGFTAVNVLLMFVNARFAVGLGATQVFASDMGTFLVANGMAIGVFILLGVFAGNGHRSALAVGMLLYAGDLAWLLANQPARHMVSVAVHGIFLVSLVKAFPRGAR